MKIYPPNESVIIEHSTGLGTLTQDMVRKRAVELALINGREAQHLTGADWDQALQELTGSPATMPEAEHWSSAPGSAGNIVPVPSSDDEDEDGRSFSERLVEEGVNEAAHDQMLNAARIARESDQREVGSE